MKYPKDKVPPVSDPQGTDQNMLYNLQRETFVYFLEQVDPVTGLIADKTKPGCPSSIAATGMGISTYLIGIENKFLSRKDAINRILKILRFFYNSHQGNDPNATGYKGFYYHFLKMQTGKRAWKCELSTIDTALFIAGVISAATYFSGNDKDEAEIRQLADTLYRRIDWQWALNGGVTITHGWKPEYGFIKHRWSRDYSEALLLYILAMGSPTFPIKAKGYKEWISTFKLKKIHDLQYLYAGPLFIHQFSHMWIDFRNIHDDFNKKAGFDYFENSKRATYIHRQYAISNSKKFEQYNQYCWGLTASAGPGYGILKIKGNKRKFYDYKARGAPFGPDDGTVSPWAIVGSLPFAPEIVIDTIRHEIERLGLKHAINYGFDASFNPTYPENTANPNGWVSPWIYGINQGPIIIMIENYHSELMWNIMRQCPYLIKGLRAAGYSGGWLNSKTI